MQAEEEREDGDMESEDLLNLQEKATNILDKEEELINNHMNLIKENAQLLTKEGELISYVQGNTVDMCDAGCRERRVRDRELRGQDEQDHTEEAGHIRTAQGQTGGFQEVAQGGRGGAQHDCGQGVRVQEMSRY